MKSTYLVVLGLALTFGLQIGCKSKAPKEKSGDSIDSTPSTMSTYPNIICSATGAIGPTIVTTLNTPVSLSFSCTENGMTVAITRIEVSQPQPANLVTTTNSISFTPTTAMEQNGTITVFANTSNGEGSEVFYWTPNLTANNSTACTTAILTQALEAFKNKQAPTLEAVIALFPACKDNLANLLNIFKK